MPRRDLLLSHPQQILECLSHPGAKRITEFLANWLQEEEKVLHESGTIDVIYRTQGKIEVLKRVLSIEQDTKEFQEGLLKGQFKEQGAPNAKTMVRW